jgi:AcrR family transcriptional regulator
LEDAQTLRKDLLQAASELFAEGGLDAVSVRAVAARVGVSTMTPYRYFADKAELLSGLWQSVLKAALECAKAASSRHTSGRGRLRASLDAYIGYWEAHPDHYRLVYSIEGVTKGGRVALAEVAPVYAELMEHTYATTQALADELGAGATHARLANDIRLVMTLGCLHVAHGNRRYAWFDWQQLRATYIDQIVATMARCLTQGPPETPPETALAPAEVE